MTREDVQSRLDRYVAAWVGYDPAAIGDLFSAGARYRYHPADEPVVGRGDRPLVGRTVGRRERP